MPTIISAKKEGPIAYFYTDNGKAYTYNFQTMEMIGVTGRTLNNLFTIIKAIPKNLLEKDRDTINLCRLIESLAFYRNIQGYSAIAEAILSYPDLISFDTFCSQTYETLMYVSDCEKLPKGYIKFVRKTNNTINPISAHAFNLERGLVGFTTEQANFIRKWEGSGTHKFKFYPHICMYKEEIPLVKKIIKCIKNSEGKNLDLDNYLIRIFEISENLKIDNVINRIDDNRGLDSVLDTLRLMSIENETELTKQQKLIKSLDGLQINKFKVVVPFILNDLIDEGIQQKNCVASYTVSIMMGDKLVYFLREKENPSKSYITCSYNREKRKTTEHRYACNRNCDYLSTMETIDEMIRELVPAQK